MRWEELGFTAEILGLYGSSESSWVSACEEAWEQTRDFQFAGTVGAGVWPRRFSYISLAWGLRMCISTSIIKFCCQGPWIPFITGSCSTCLSNSISTMGSPSAVPQSRGFPHGMQWGALSKYTWGVGHCSRWGEVFFLRRWHLEGRKDHEEVTTFARQ